MRKLPAFTEKGPARFTESKCVLIEIQETIDSRGVVHDLLQWLGTEGRFYPIRTLCVGARVRA